MPIVRSSETHRHTMRKDPSLLPLDPGICPSVTSASSTQSSEVKAISVRQLTRPLNCERLFNRDIRPAATWFWVSEVVLPIMNAVSRRRRVRGSLRTSLHANGQI